MTSTESAPGPGDVRDTEDTDDAAPAGSSGSHTARYTAVAVGVVALLLVGVLATREDAASKIAKSPLVGRQAPALAGPTLAGDAPEYDLLDVDSRWVLVNFFATWCVPCVREHDDLVTFSQRHDVAGDAEVVAVVFDDEPDAVRRFFEERGGRWPVVEDPVGRIALDWGVAGIPESYLVDPAGVVRAKITGGVEADFLEQVLSDLEAGTP